MSIPWMIFEIGLNAFEVAFTFSLMHANLEKKAWVKKSYMVAYFFLTVIFLSIVNFATSFSLVSLYVFPITLCTFSLIFLKGTLTEYLLWLTLPFAILSFLDVIVITFSMLTNNVDFSIFMTQSGHRLLTAIISKFICFFVYLYLRKRKIVSNTTSHNMVTLLSFVIIGTLTTILFLVNSKFPEIWALQRAPSVSLIFAGATVMFYHYIIFRNFEENKDRLEEYIKEEKEQHIKEIEQINQETIWKVINAYKGVRRARLVFSKEWKPIRLANKDDNVQLIYELGDDLADAVIAVKEVEAFEEGIEFVLEGLIPARHTITSEELCIILDAILTNAIEHTKMIIESDATKIINLSFLDYTDGFIIQIENPINDINYSPNLDTIQSIIDRYQGKVTVEVDSLYQTILIYLPYLGLLVKNERRMNNGKKTS